MTVVQLESSPRHIPAGKVLAHGVVVVPTASGIAGAHVRVRKVPHAGGVTKLMSRGAQKIRLIGHWRAGSIVEIDRSVKYDTESNDHEINWSAVLARVGHGQGRGGTQRSQVDSIPADTAGILRIRRCRGCLTAIHEVGFCIGACVIPCLRGGIDSRIPRGAAGCRKLPANYVRDGAIVGPSVSSVVRIWSMCLRNSHRNYRVGGHQEYAFRWMREPLVSRGFR